MRKFSKFLLIFAVGFFGFVYMFTSNAQASNSLVDGKVGLHDLPEDTQKQFLQNGFSENDEYFEEKVVQSDPNNKVRAVNVVTIAGSTRASSKTLAYTAYVITSSRAPLLTANTRLHYGNYYADSSVKMYKGPFSYTGGIYFSHNGKAKYFPCKLVSQVTTTWGKTPVSKSCGGVTLGK